jgi:hypothetical protein
MDTLIGRHDSAATLYAENHTINVTNNYPTEAWQYGPRFFAAQRGGWSPSKESYPLVPGKHRWMRITNTQFANGGPINFAPEMDFRPTNLTLTMEQPQ